MTKIRVFAKRPTPLDDLNLTTILDFNTEFNIDLYQQLDEQEPTLVHAETFIPSTGPGPVTPPTPICGPHSSWDGEKCQCDPGFHDEGGVCVSDDILPPDDKVLYDSNRDGKWDNGKKRTVVKSEGDIKANGKGLYMAASGSPQLEIQGDGEAWLVTKPGFGRFYVASKQL